MHTTSKKAMKAIVFEKYGSPDVLKLKEIEKPSPGDNEVLIRIRAATITPGDCELRTFKFSPLFWLPLRLVFGIFKPRIKIMGQELSGEIESVGSNVKTFKKGDKVFCPAKIFGAYTQYICLPCTHAIATKPSNMSFGEAAVVPTGGLNALYFIRKAKVKSGERVLVDGAAGNIGAFAVQLAKYYGAEVTGVDSASKLETLRMIGADHVIDYTKENFTKNGKTYDVIFDVTTKISFIGCLSSLNKNGRFVIASPALVDMILGLCFSVIGKKRVVTGLAPYKKEDLDFLKELIEQGKIKSLIDRRYSFENIAEGHRYVESGQKIGNVVIDVE
jgi:NADPH:quinone reductase-like Zn-dependent oxidoreductase